MKKTMIVLVCVTLVFVLSLVILNNQKMNVNSLDNIGETFYAKIKKINEYNGTTTILVEGIEGNDINHTCEFTFSINNTEILYNNQFVDKSYLELGQTISIISYGGVMETYPARLTDVEKIIILENR